MIVTRREDFCYGHFLPNHPGKCRFLHGHSATLDVSVSGPVKGETGMVIDFGDLKKVIRTVIEKYDHKMIFGPGTPSDLLEVMHSHDWPYVLLDSPPTAEVIADRIMREISRLLPEFTYVSVRLYETERNWVEIL